MYSSLLIIVAVAAVASIGWALWERRRRREERRRLEDECAQLRREATARIGRLERELDDARKTGHLDFAEEMMEIVETLKRARSDPEGSDGPPSRSALAEGLDMVDKNITQAFRRHGLTPIEPAPGDPFDPNVHEAWSTEDVSDDRADLICAVHRRGWTFDDRVVRPAAVTVGVRTEVVLDDPGEHEADEPEQVEARQDSSTD